MAGWIPDILTRPFFRGAAGVHVVGVDEDTAIVGGPDDWVVRGRQSAWLLSDGKRRESRPWQSSPIPDRPQLDAGQTPRSTAPRIAMITVHDSATWSVCRSARRSRPVIAGRTGSRSTWRRATP